MVLVWNYRLLLECCKLDADDKTPRVANVSATVGNLLRLALDPMLCPAAQAAVDVIQNGSGVSIQSAQEY